MPFEDYIGLIQQNKYVYSLSILIAFFTLSKLIVLISRKVVLKLTKKTKTEIDDIIVAKTNKPISLIFLLLGFRLALFPLEISANISRIAGNTITSLIIIVGTYVAIVIVDALVYGWVRDVVEKTKSKFDKELIPLSRRFSRIFFGILGLLFILVMWGVQIGPLLTSLGIAGIAIALALQNTLGNIFAGLSMILDKSIKVGDVIKLDDNSIGTIIDIGLRSTKIRTADNEIVTISNGKLADSKILNYQQPDPTVRTMIDFGVKYGSDVSKVRKIVIDTIKKVQGVLKKPEPQVLLVEMGDFALKFKVLFWVSSFDIKFVTKALATEEIYNALTKARIEIPFPTRTVYIKNKK